MNETTNTFDDWLEQGWLHKPFNVEFSYVDANGKEHPARLDNVIINELSNDGFIIDYSFDCALYQTDDFNWIEPSDSMLNHVVNKNRMKKAIKERYQSLPNELKKVKTYQHTLLVIDSIQKIADNEPVFVLRAQDKSAGKSVLQWIIDNYDNLNANENKLREAFDCAMEMRSYAIIDGRNAD